MEIKLSPCALEFVTDTKVSKYDTYCFIDRDDQGECTSYFAELRSIDKAFDTEVSCFKCMKSGKRIVYAPVEELTDYHDVRAYAEAAGRAVSRAIKAGSKSPLLFVPKCEKFVYTQLCTVLGALHELYVPIQLREDVPEKSTRLNSLGVVINNSSVAAFMNEIKSLEAGRMIARDIGVGDPERMTPPRVEEYVRKAFPSLKIDVISDIEIIRKEYPLFEAVNRAAHSVPRHQGRIIFLEYKPPKPAKKTLMLVGKGVTYDTGGADIKAGGIMAGMSRDKCGAAAVAGFMQVVQQQKPQDIHVIAALCMVRNSVGEECYVSDEVITSRGGIRVRVGNTDAEGRMCMADALCKMKELAQNLPDPHLFTIATLTGHACLAVGEGYSIIMDNSVARQVGHAQTLQKIGEDVGEPFEISVLRYDDFAFNIGKVIGEDILQCNNLPSSRTPRGHQVPATFMMSVTGLDKHGLSSSKPIKYTHLDIAASAGEFPKIPTATPIVALAKTHLV